MYCSLVSFTSIELHLNELLAVRDSVIWKLKPSSDLNFRCIWLETSVVMFIPQVKQGHQSYRTEGSHRTAGQGYTVSVLGAGAMMVLIYQPSLEMLPLWVLLKTS